MLLCGAGCQPAAQGDGWPLGQIRLCNLRSRREPGSFELSISLNRSSYSSASRRVISPRVTRTSEVSEMLEEFSKESLRLLIILRISTTSMRLKRIIRAVPTENQDIANIHCQRSNIYPILPKQLLRSMYRPRSCRRRSSNNPEFQMGARRWSIPPGHAAIVVSPLADPTL